MKYKKVKTTKVTNRKRQLAIERRKKTVHEELEQACREGRHIVFLDEIMFTRRTFRTKEFSARGENICIDLNQLNIQTTATIAAISMQQGLITWKSYPKSINQIKFVEWLQLLLKRTGKRRVALFMDNLRVHHTKLVK